MQTPNSPNYHHKNCMGEVKRITYKILGVKGLNKVKISDREYGTARQSFTETFVEGMRRLT